MIIKPKIRGFICTTAHPAGCYQETLNQIQYVKQQPRFEGPKNALIIGASTGYGLATRIALAFSAGTKTLGVAFEKEAAGKRTASAGWYNTAAFETLANEDNIFSQTIIGDAFSNEIKQQVVDAIKLAFPEGIDCVVYSLAAPRREDPETQTVYHSALKTLRQPFIDKTIDVFSGQLSDVRIEPASEQELIATQKVMGGEDWLRWIQCLSNEGLLAQEVKTLAYSYIGPKLTYPIYREGTIGKAKEHLERTARQLDELLAPLNGAAFVSVNKALVTQSSAAIPVVPLYISLLYKIMKEKNIHEGCIEQMYRLYAKALYAQDSRLPVDKMGLLRMDDWEMRDDVQQEIAANWALLTQDNIHDYADLKGYCQDFYHLFGFDVDGIDYEKELDAAVAIPSLKQETA